MLQCITDEHIHGGVTIVTAATAVSQQSNGQLPERVQSMVKAAQKQSQSSGPSVEQTQITVLQFAPNWNGL